VAVRVASSSIANGGEFVANRARLLQLRRAGLVALAAWPAFAVLDWFIVSFVQPGRFGFHLALRVLGLFLLGIAVAVIHGRRTLSPRLLVLVETFICTSLSTLVSVQCLEFRGIASPLSLGVVTILLFRSAMLSDHIKRAAIPVLGTSLAYPIVLLLLATISPSLRAQFADAQDLGTFLLNTGFIFAAAAITLIGGHAVWTLRREVSETRSLGRYQLKELVGQGGMGEVWSAYHVALRRNVAVKILRPDSNTDDMAIQRFEREARATAELNHPNTVRVYDYGVTEDGLWYYAMELLEGEDLGSVLKRGPVEPARAADLLLQASRALAEAHRRGIVHRDIKPANLFLCTLGGDADFVKVLDFGLAKLAEGGSSAHLTQTGMAVGTPSYVSPEVVLGHHADARSDVYALGAVLYALIAGRPPFAGDDMRSVLLAHLRDAPIPPSRVLGRPIPAALESIIMRCLEKDPNLRYADAGQLAEALMHWRSAPQVETPTPAAEAPSLQIEAPPPRRHRRLREPAGEHRHPSPRERSHIDAPAPAPALAPSPVLEPLYDETPAPTFLGETDWEDYLDGQSTVAEHDSMA